MNTPTRDEVGNVVRAEGFSQVVIWSGTVVGKDNVDAFVAFMLEEMGVRIQYLEEVLTHPTPGEMDTGGRSDLLFAVHQEDVCKFALKRFQLQDTPSWIEDAYGNGRGYLYDARVASYKTWTTNSAPFMMFGEDAEDEESED